MLLHVPGSLDGLLSLLVPCFTQPTFQTFRGLLLGQVSQTGSRTVCGMLVAARLWDVWEHSRAHRFFSKARWSPDQLGLDHPGFDGDWVRWRSLGGHSVGHPEAHPAGAPHPRMGQPRRSARGLRPERDRQVAFNRSARPPRDRQRLHRRLAHARDPRGPGFKVSAKPGMAQYRPLRVRKSSIRTSTINEAQAPEDAARHTSALRG